MTTVCLIIDLGKSVAFADICFFKINNPSNTTDNTRNMCDLYVEVMY